MAQSLTPEGKVLQDLTTRFQVYLERVKNGQIAEIDDVIREFSSIAERSLGSASLTTQWKVRDVLRGMNTKMRAAAKRHKKEFTQSLNDIATTAAEYETSAINKLSPKKVKMPSASSISKVVRESTIQATGTQMEAFVDSWSESAIRRVNKAVSVGAAQGLTNQEIVQQIRGTRANNFRDGILGNATKREADAMVRTATQHAASAAQAEVYRDNDDIIEGYIWISTLDGRTSATCRALDLQQFEIDKGPLPPIHVNCRSSTIPKIEGVDLLSNTTRASEDGPVPADMSYYEWLKGQSPEFQDEVLGKARGELFRAEGMNAEVFSSSQLDKTFQPMTVGEVREAVSDVVDIEPPSGTPKFPVPVSDEKLRAMSPEDLQEYARTYFTHEDFDSSIMEALQAGGVEADQWREVFATHNALLRELDIPKFGSYGRYGEGSTVYGAYNMVPEVNLQRLSLKPVGSVWEKKAGKLPSYHDLLNNQEFYDEVRKIKGGFPWQVVTDLNSTFIHELGHHLDNSLGWSGSKWVADRYGGWWDATGPLSHIFQSPYRYTVSEYGSVNIMEMIAESFALWRRGDATQFWRIHPDLLAQFEALRRKTP